MKLPILALLDIKVKIRDMHSSCEENLSDENCGISRRTLMDVVRSESFPKLNFPKKSDLINSFLTTRNVDIISSLFILPKSGKLLNVKSLMFDAVVHQVKTVLKGTSYQNKDNFQRLLVSIGTLGPMKTSLKVEIVLHQSFLNASTHLMILKDINMVQDLL